MNTLIKQITGAFFLIGGALLLPSLTHACGNPDIGITKTGPATATSGSLVTYTLTARTFAAPHAQSGIAATNVVVTDTFSGLTLHSVTSSQPDRLIWQQIGNTITLKLRPVHPVHIQGNFGWVLWQGAVDTTTFTLTFQVPSNTACGSTSTNTATITADNADPNPGNNTSVVNTQIICPATPTPTATITPTPTTAPTATPTATPDKPECSDAKDNDGDGLVDADDPGCHTNSDLTKKYNPDDDDERNGQCSDKKDNDGDGLIDRKDPDCHTDNNPKNDDSFDGDRDEDTDNRVKAIKVVTRPAPPVKVTAKTGPETVLALTLTTLGITGLSLVRKLSA